jgi:plastocyanin
MTSGFAFSPRTLSIAVGDRVKVTNTDTIDHTFTDSGHFDSGDLGLNATFTYRFTTKGTFNYVCTYHGVLYNMRGTVTVH